MYTVYIECGQLPLVTEDIVTGAKSLMQKTMFTRMQEVLMIRCNLTKVAVGLNCLEGNGERGKWTSNQA